MPTYNWFSLRKKKEKNGKTPIKLIGLEKVPIELMTVVDW
jgi:hypothetical protein